MGHYTWPKTVFMYLIICAKGKYMLIEDVLYNIKNSEDRDEYVSTSLLP
jgi:hypothetical protein